MKPKLTPAEHIKLGAMLKQARNALLSAAVMTRGYGRLSREPRPPTKTVGERSGR